MRRRGENIYRRKDGRWEGRYVKDRDAKGAIRYGYVYRRSYKAVSKELQAKKRQQREHQAISYTGTCEEWFHTWLEEEVQPRVKQSTFINYQHKCNAYILPEIGRMPLNQLTTVRLQQALDGWHRRFAMNTVLLLYRIINNCLRVAVQQHHLRQNPCQQVVLPKQRVPSERALTIGEQKQLEAAAIGDSQGLIVLLALHTGLRLGELAALQWQDIDFAKKEIRVTHTYQRLPLAQDKGKTKLVYTQIKVPEAAQTIFISKNAARWLNAWKQQKTSLFVFSTKGKPMEPRLITYHFQRIRKAAGLDTITFQQLRLTYAASCMEMMKSVLLDD